MAACSGGSIGDGNVRRIPAGLRITVSANGRSPGGGRIAEDRATQVVHAESGNVGADGSRQRVGDGLGKDRQGQGEQSEQVKGRHRKREYGRGCREKRVEIEGRRSDRKKFDDPVNS